MPADISFLGIIQLQKVLHAAHGGHGSVPVVLNPLTAHSVMLGLIHSGGRGKEPFGYPLVHPSPELCYKYGATTVKQLLSALSRLGIAGASSDPIDFARLYAAFPQSRSFLTSWLDHVSSGSLYQVQISAGWRGDLTSEYEAAAEFANNELAALSSRHPQDAQGTFAAAMLRDTIRNWVMPASAAEEQGRQVGRRVLPAVIYTPLNVFDTADIESITGRIIDNVATIVQSAGGVPITWGSKLP